MTDCLLVMMSVVVDMGADMGFLDSVEQPWGYRMDGNFRNVAHGGTSEGEVLGSKLEDRIGL